MLVSTVATNNANPPMEVITSALSAPSTDAPRLSQKPISRKLLIEVSSQKANSRMKLSANTSPSIAPPNSSRYV